MDLGLQLMEGCVVAGMNSVAKQVARMLLSQVRMGGAIYYKVVYYEWMKELKIPSLHPGGQVAPRSALQQPATSYRLAGRRHTWRGSIVAVDTLDDRCQAGRRPRSPSGRKRYDGWSRGRYSGSGAAAGRGPLGHRPDGGGTVRPAGAVQRDASGDLRTWGVFCRLAFVRLKFLGIYYPLTSTLNRVQQQGVLGQAQDFYLSTPLAVVFPAQQQHSR